MGLGWIIVIAFWVLVIVGIVLLIRLLVKSGKQTHHEESALDILRKRYARGEISREEFQQMKDDITGT